jgi:hypothetical protein
MNTQNTTTENNLSLDLLRKLALMQHLGEDYFIVNGIPYIGEEDAAKESYESAKEDYESFEDFCSNEVEELDVDNCYNVDYYVLTDEEADEKWEESLDSYIEECITPEIDKISEGQGNLGYYITFDEEMWKRDAKMDGRGHSLSSYDGNENEETVQGTTFYIYRIN